MWNQGALKTCTHTHTHTPPPNSLPPVFTRLCCCMVGTVKRRPSWRAMPSSSDTRTWLKCAPSGSWGISSWLSTMSESWPVSCLTRKSLKSKGKLQVNTASVADRLCKMFGNILGCFVSILDTEWMPWLQKKKKKKKREEVCILSYLSHNLDELVSLL